MKIYFAKPLLFVSLVIQIFFTLDLFSEKKPLINLDDFIEDFVLESKQISLEEFPQAFNPSITKWKNAYLMCFRIRDPLTNSTYRIGLVKLDNNFNIVGKPYELYMPLISNDPNVREQDPRLIVRNEKLYMVYSTTVKASSIATTRRMFVAELEEFNDKLRVGLVEGPLSFEGESDMRLEKNWTPFIYNDILLLTYSINPHRILLKQFGNHFCETLASTETNINWDYGVLRGGTPAYLDGNQYLSFFHSSTNMATVQSNGVKFTHYFMGAYTFSKAPPFQITHVSPQPIVGKGYYSGEPYKTWKPLRVIFPGGLIVNDQYIWVVCGKQDHEIWIYKFDKQGLLDSLVPVKPKKEEIIWKS